MTNLEIALKLREQIKEQWPFVSTILTLYENNKPEITAEDFQVAFGSYKSKGIFTEHIQDMVDRLLPKEVYFYQISFNNIDLQPILIGGKLESNGNIYSLPINQVLFSSENNPLGILK